MKTQFFGKISAQKHNSGSITSLLRLIYTSNQHLTRRTKMAVVHYLLIISISIPCILAQTISWDSVFDAGLDDEFINKKRETCTDVESVTLSNLGLKQIPEHVVRSHAIRSISMENNDISVISTELLDDVPNLECLNLARNRIPYQLMFGFKHDRLKTLILDHQRKQNYAWGLQRSNYYEPLLETSHKHASFLPSLESLHLSGVDFEYFIPYFNASFPALSELYIDDNDLQYLREDIFSILPQHLKRLHLEKNKFRNLVFHSLGGVEELYLDDNPLDSVEIVDFNSLLNKLSISNCNMTDVRLVHVLSRYSYLITTLDLSHNRIESYNFQSHKMLQHLSLSHNHLTTMRDISHLKRLNSLSLSYNLIKRVPTLSMPESLKRLNLRGNEISEIDIEAFENLAELEELDLAENQLKYLPHEWHSNLGMLRYLNLNENQFASIENMIVKPLSNLRELHIAKNPIKSIGYGSLGLLPDQCVLYVLSTKNEL